MARLLIVVSVGAAAMAGCSAGHASALRRGPCLRCRAQSRAPSRPPASRLTRAQPPPRWPPTIGIDPGHNGGNTADPAFINSIIWNGRENETCDTTGTQTDGGYTEASFNWNVARYLQADLRRAGAAVVMTRHGNNGVGPCVTSRAHILNRAGATVALDIHADGGPAWGRGFTVLEPVADGPNDGVITASERLGNDVRSALLKYTSMPESNDDGLRRPHLPERSRGPQPGHRAEGPGRMRQHAQPHRRPAAHRNLVPAAPGAGAGGRPRHLPRRRPWRPPATRAVT